MPVESPILIHVTSRRALDDRLELAVKKLQAEAMQARANGILVTRHKPDTYTVRLSAQVPFGITLETDELTETEKNECVVIESTETYDAALPG